MSNKSKALKAVLQKGVPTVQEIAEAIFSLGEKSQSERLKEFKAKWGISDDHPSATWIYTTIQMLGAEMDSTFKQMQSFAESILQDEDVQKVLKEKVEFLGAGMDVPSKRLLLGLLSNLGQSPEISEPLLELAVRSVKVYQEKPKRND